MSRPLSRPLSLIYRCRRSIRRSTSSKRRPRGSRFATPRRRTAFKVCSPQPRSKNDRFVVSQLAMSIGLQLERFVFQLALLKFRAGWAFQNLMVKKLAGSKFGRNPFIEDLTDVFEWKMKRVFRRHRIEGHHQVRRFGRLEAFDWSRQGEAHA